MINKVIEVINSCETFLITAHVRLDGDAVGSELALYHVLRNMGKKAVIYNQDRTPDVYTFLPASNVIINDLDSVEIFDAAFVLDCSDIERVGEEAKRIISIKYCNKSLYGYSYRHGRILLFQYGELHVFRGGKTCRSWRRSSMDSGKCI
ncbi:MAG: hypothetical protein B1H13_13025 [Desulfobacteraceae bacterium 4484_190.3]|nr:MAG: hypothetical protein B1H13_13025 [Desulfobacteraceae bacterium 4484_190.3]